MKRLLIPALLAAAVVAGCGGGSSSTNASNGGTSSGGAYSSRAATPAPTDTSGSAAMVKTADGPLGTFLVDAKGRSLYLRWREANTDLVADMLSSWDGDDLDVLSDVLERLVLSLKDLGREDEHDR